MEGGPKVSLRTRLALLVAGAVLPLALGAGITTYYLSEASDEAASAHLLHLSRSLLSTVEARVEAVIGAAQALSVSQELQNSDLQGFRRHAEAFLHSFMPSANFVLSDVDETQLVNTADSSGSRMRKNIGPESIEAHREVFATGKPVLSRLFTGQVIGEAAVSVNVPVMRSGRVVYNLGLPLTSRSLSQMLIEQRLDESWTVAIWDRAATVIARSHDWERYVGQKASPSIYPAIMARQDQVLSSVTFDGQRVMTAIAHAPAIGLTLAVGVPEATLRAPARDALLLILAFSLGCLALSGGFAARLAGQVLLADREKEILVQELGHRVSNLLATVQGIAAQTARASDSKQEGFARLQERIAALARAQRIVTDHKWEAAPVRRVVEAALEPFLGTASGVELAGNAEVSIGARTALAITLAIHELATNAVKYGALSTPSGKVRVSWKSDNGKHVILEWEESGGPAVQAPVRKGFGSTLLERGLTDGASGSANVEYRPSGVRCVLRLPGN
jgi:two-component sensor histidine kinase